MRKLSPWLSVGIFALLTFGGGYLLAQAALPRFSSTFASITAPAGPDPQTVHLADMGMV